MLKRDYFLSIIGTLCGIAGCVISFSESKQAGLIALMITSLIILASFIIRIFEDKKHITLPRYLLWRRGKGHDGYRVLKREAVYVVNSKTSAQYSNTIHGKSKKDCLEDVSCKFIWDQDEDFEFDNDENGSVYKCIVEESRRIAYYKFNKLIAKNELFKATFKITNLHTTASNFKNHQFLSINTGTKRTKQLQLTVKINSELQPINYRFIIKDKNGKIIQNNNIEPETKDGYIILSSKVDYPLTNRTFILIWDCLNS